MTSALLRFIQRQMAAFDPFLIVLATASGFFSYQSMALYADDLMSHAQAMIFACGIGSGLFMIWKAIFYIALAIEEMRSRLIALLIIITLAVPLFLISGIQNSVGMVGEEPLEIHLSSYAPRLATSSRAIFETALSIESVETSIRSERARMERARKSELRHGAYSGKVGDGAVTRAFKGVEGRLTDLEKEIALYRAHVEASQSRVLERLELIRTIASSPASLEERMQTMARESDKIRTELARMDIAKISSSVERTLSALPREVEIQSIFSKDPQVAASQQRALNKVRDDIQHTITSLNGFLSALEIPDLDAISFQEIKPVRALFLYWQDFITLWVAGIALDLAPLPVLLIMMVGVHSSTAEELARTRRGSMSFDDVLDALDNLSDGEHRNIPLQQLEQNRQMRIGQQKRDAAREESTDD